MLTKSRSIVLFVAILVLILMVPTSNVNSGSPSHLTHLNHSASFPLSKRIILQNSQYSVAFVEIGLPSGTVWSVQLGAYYKTTNLTSITFSVSNSSYLYFTYVMGENSYLSSGTVDVMGGDSVVNLVFNTLDFKETGIPSGDQWKVEISDISGFSAYESSTNSSIVFVVVNGSYFYCVYTTANNMQILATSGNVAISNNNLQISFSFDSIVFSASGYPFEWEITLTNKSNYGNSIYATSSTFTVYVLAGNYTYTAEVVLKTGFSYYFAKGYVNTSKSISYVTFNLQNVTINETGLPPGAFWAIAITDKSILPNTIITAETDSGAFSIYLESGNYTYTKCVYSNGYLTYSNITPLPMNITKGMNSEDVLFKGIIATTFQETGINLSNASWGISITVGSSLLFIGTYSPELTLFLSNGSYTYHLRNNWFVSSNGVCVDSDYVSSAKTISVKGSAQPQIFHFYQVNYNETGMPFGAAWYMYIYQNGTWIGYSYSAYPEVTFFLPASTYIVNTTFTLSYWQSPFTGVVENSYSHYLNVSTGEYNRSVDFYLENGYFTVTINAINIQSGNDWVGELSNSTTYSESDLYSQFGGFTYYSLNQMTFIAQNGSYKYHVYNNYYGYPTVKSGTFNISGKNVTIVVNFGFLSNATAIFIESGLSLGTEWNVTIGGVTHSSNFTHIYFTFSLGNYIFKASTETGYNVYPESGVLHLTVYGCYRVTVSYVREINVSSPYVRNTIDLNSYRAYTGDFYQSDQQYGSSAMVYDKTNNIVYLVNSVALYAINTSDLSVFSVNSGLSMPSGVALDPENGILYVSDLETNNIAILNASSANILGYINTGTNSNPSELLFDSYNQYLYVYEGGAKALSIINTTTEKVVGEIPIQTNGQTVFSLSLDNLNGNVFLTDSCTGNISIISGIVVLKNITVPSWYSVTGSVFVPSNGYLYLIGTAGIVMETNVNSGQIVKTINIPNAGTSIAFDQESNTLAITNYSYNGNPSSIFFVNVSNSTYIGSVPVGYNPESIVLGGAASDLYIMNMGSDTVSIISDHYSQYNVTFFETGLSPGQTWYVNFGGISTSSTDSSIIFVVSNGTYDYSIGSVNGFSPSPSSGSLTVRGPVPVITITFTGNGSVVSLYVVKFEESGLPKGTEWFVNLNGKSENSTGNNITFDENNGTYSFAITPKAGYTTMPKNGSVSIKGQPLSIMVYFKPNSSPTSSNLDGILLITLLLAASVIIIMFVIFLSKKRGLW